MPKPTKKFRHRGRLPKRPDDCPGDTPEDVLHEIRKVDIRVIHHPGVPNRPKKSVSVDYVVVHLVEALRRMAACVPSTQDGSFRPKATPREIIGEAVLRDYIRTRARLDRLKRERPELRHDIERCIAETTMATDLVQRRKELYDAQAVVESKAAPEKPEVGEWGRLSIDDLMALGKE